MSNDNANNNIGRTAATGNASNPSPQNDSLMPPDKSQWLDEKAEKYLREVANIEDEPDAQDQQDMDEILKEEKSK